MYSKRVFFAVYRDIIVKIDKDKDSYVSDKELIAWIKYIQKTYVSDDAKRQWTDFDKGEKDTLSWEEFAKRTYGGHAGGR